MTVFLFLIGTVYPWALEPVKSKDERQELLCSTVRRTPSSGLAPFNPHPKSMLGSGSMGPSVSTYSSVPASGLTPFSISGIRVDQW